MSTDEQCDSLASQAFAIAAYAERRGYEVVRTYQDEGKSGLHLKNRKGLQRLLADALSPERVFEAVLVLDVSRWGRFQDLDQSAHYEFLCREAGVEVVYCAEAFDNDGSHSAALLKGLKRLMAAEYSREISVKVRAAKLRQARLGFRQGGPVVYGVERWLVDAASRRRGVIPRGRRKAQSDDRILLRPGPEAEIQTLRRIFRRFVVDRRNGRSIADELNADGVPFLGGRPWNRDVIIRLLQNELMIGVYLYNRRSTTLKSPVVFRPQEDWVRVQVFEPIIDPGLFARAQKRLATMRQHPPSEALLQGLRRILRRHGRITAELIDACDDLPSRHTYYRRFGALTHAYALIGYSHEAGPGRWGQAHGR